MSFLKKIFGYKSKSKDLEIKSEASDRYMPESKPPADEQFAINFSHNGGKFLYCEDFNEVLQNLDRIVSENGWQHDKTLVLAPELADRFGTTDLNITDRLPEASIFLTTCESLIAKDGSILSSSRQIFEKKLIDYPLNCIIFATTSQIVESISEGLRIIKARSKTTIPTNITTIKYFKTDDGDNFLSYGSSTKNLYLLLLEDL